MGRAIADPESPDRPSESLASGGTRAAGGGTQRKIPSSGHLNERGILDCVAWRFPGRNGKRKESASVPFFGLDGSVCDRSGIERGDPDNPGLNS